MTTWITKVEEQLKVSESLPLEHQVSDAEIHRYKVSLNDNSNNVEVVMCTELKVFTCYRRRRRCQDGGVLRRRCHQVLQSPRNVCQSFHAELIFFYFNIIQHNTVTHAWHRIRRFLTNKTTIHVTHWSIIWFTQGGYPGSLRFLLLFVVEWLILYIKLVYLHWIICNVHICAGGFFSMYALHTIYRSIRPLSLVNQMYLSTQTVWTLSIW